MVNIFIIIEQGYLILKGIIKTDKKKENVFTTGGKIKKKCYKEGTRKENGWVNREGQVTKKVKH